MSQLVNPIEREVRDNTIAALTAAFLSPREISVQMQLPLSTVYSSLKQPHTRLLIAQYTSERLRPMLQQIEREVTRSIATLTDVRDNEFSKQSERANAAGKILDFYLKIQERTDITNRLTMIEATLAQRAPADETQAEDDGVYEATAPPALAPPVAPPGLVADD